MTMVEWVVTTTSTTDAEEDDYDEEDDDCADNYDNAEGDVAHDVWGLPSRLNLATLAADFYLLYELALDGFDDGAFDAYIDRWLPTFKNYTDMVVGGELRHAMATGSSRIWTMKTTPLHDALKQGDLCSGERSAAWTEWHEFRQQHGVDALVWAVKIYNVWASDDYGGKKWASIADALLMVERGTTSPVTFIDMCWGLQHNGGAYFSKVDWSMFGLAVVLDANLNGKTKDVLKKASTEVVDAYQKAYK